MGGGQGVELVSEADVVDQSQPPPQRDRLRIVGGEEVAGERHQRGHARARGHEDQLALGVRRHHGPAGRAPEHHFVAHLQAGEVQRERAVGHGPHQKVEPRRVGGVGQDAVRAAAEPPALEVGLHPHELPRIEREELAVGHLQGDPERPRRRQLVHRDHTGQPLVPAGAEPAVVNDIHGRPLGGVGPPTGRSALEVARPQTGPGLLLRLAGNQPSRPHHEGGFYDRSRRNRGGSSRAGPKTTGTSHHSTAMGTAMPAATATPTPVP